MVQDLAFPGTWKVDDSRGHLIKLSKECSLDIDIYRCCDKIADVEFLSDPAGCHAGRSCHTGPPLRALSLGGSLEVEPASTEVELPLFELFRRAALSRSSLGRSRAPLFKLPLFEPSALRWRGPKAIPMAKVYNVSRNSEVERKECHHLPWAAARRLRTMKGPPPGCHDISRHYLHHMEKGIPIKALHFPADHLHHPKEETRARGFCWLGQLAPSWFVQM